MNRAPWPAPVHPWAIQRLEDERVLMLDHLARLRRSFEEIVEASADSNADDEHDPEGSTIAFERSQLESLIRQAQRHLDDLGDARLRVAGGRYGLCERCGDPISTARLDALPVARRCIACAAIAR